jgi:hypothetical protein
LKNGKINKPQIFKFFFILNCWDSTRKDLQDLDFLLFHVTQNLH